MQTSKKTTLTSVLLLGVFIVSSLGSVMALTNYTITVQTGHNFTEEYWAIEYDVTSGKLLKDYTPGEFQDEYNSSLPDRAPYFDANYYIAYLQTGQVQTLYMAFLNHSRDTRNTTFFGMSPYQIIQQHFRTPAGKHVIVQNSFAGLLAYQDTGIKNGVPDRNDSVYYGHSLSSQYYKYLLNNRLQLTLGYRPLNESRLPTATPKIIEKTVDGDNFEYTFGITYENIFTVWSSIAVDNDLNSTDTAADLLGKIVAFSTMESLEFTYKVSGSFAADRAVNITTTTEYDIGRVSNLWVINDPSDNTLALGGYFHNILGLDKTVSHYNVSASIENRLNGDGEIPGFSLAVANYARITIIEATVEDQEDVEIVNERGDIVDGEQADYNVSALNIRAADRPAFLIDFASKPDYTLDGGEPMPAPVRMFPHVLLRDRAINQIDALTMRFLNSFNRGMVTAHIARLEEKFDLEDKEINIDVTRRQLFYAICFPTWGGKAINQDPTFVAFADPSAIVAGLLDGLGSISSFGLGMIALAGIGTTSALMVLYKRKR
jgi:hypothetical protein